VQVLREGSLQAGLVVATVPTITGISAPSITESPQWMGLGVSSLTSAD
jgi:hypothetical protein